MNVDFGKNLRNLRRIKDMTQDELAQVLGLSVQAISRYETGAAYPDIEMLPVIAGFFGTSVDELLGVSAAVREKRMADYEHRLIQITDKKERLELRRRQHAEFPDRWDVVSDMISEMIHLPECLNEMRTIVHDAMKRCDEPLWRENIMLFYLKSEPDDEKAMDFIDKWSARYDIQRTACMRYRYVCRRNTEKLRPLSQKLLRDGLVSSLLTLSEDNGEGADKGVQNCSYILEFLDVLSENKERAIPDMWIDTKLTCMLRLSDYYFILHQDKEGFETLENAVQLLENFFALPDGTILTYGTSKLDCLRARTSKNVFHNTVGNAEPTSDSMMMELVYELPLGPVNKNERYVSDIDGLERKIVFSVHTRDILKKARWNGFARVNDTLQYRTLLARVEKVVQPVY